MRKIILTVGVLSLLLTGCFSIKKKPSSTVDTSASVTSTAYRVFREHSIRVGGLNRTYSVHTPASKKALPVILNFHGGGGDMWGQADQSGMNALADKKGFMVVYPQGTGPKILGKTIGTWNAGTCCGTAKEQNVDDIAFVRAMIDDLKKNYPVDEKRIFVTGFSNGAQMSFRIACELSDIVAAVAPVDGQGLIANCDPVRPVPIMYFHGSDDPCLPYEGGEQCGGCFSEFLGTSVKNDRFTCPAVDDYMAKWREINSCGAPRSTAPRGAVTCKTTSQCADGAEVATCVVQGGGHTWAGGSYPAMCDNNPNGILCKRFKNAVGPLVSDAPINDIMLDFFVKHPLP